MGSLLVIAPAPAAELRGVGWRNRSFIFVSRPTAGAPSPLMHPAHIQAHQGGTPSAHLLHTLSSLLCSSLFLAASVPFSSRRLLSVLDTRKHATFTFTSPDTATIPATTTTTIAVTIVQSAPQLAPTPHPVLSLWQTTPPRPRTWL